MIPTFPLFKKVELEDRASVEVYTHRYPPYSDFNFTSLWAWDSTNEREISILNDNLVVRFTDYASHVPFLSFIGTQNTIDTARTLLEYASHEGLPLALQLVPEVSITGINSQEFVCEEDRDNFDYIYAISDLMTLKGGSLGRKRTTISHFKRRHPDAHIEAIDLHVSVVQQHILSIIKAWEARKKLHAPDLSDASHELAAVMRLCETSEAHTLLSTGLFSGGGMIGFSIEEPLPNDACICHFWKVDSDHPGAFGFLMQEKAKRFETLGIAQFNFEQDLGLSGLRQNKGSYGPHTFLKKYTVRPRQP